MSCTLPPNWDYRRIWYFMIKYGIYLSFISQLVKVFIWKYAKYAPRYPTGVFAASLDQDAGPNFHNFRVNIHFKISRIVSSICPYSCDLHVRTLQDSCPRTTSSEIPTSSEVAMNSLNYGLRYINIIKVLPRTSNSVF